jgi:hypothetical protein
MFVYASGTKIIQHSVCFGNSTGEQPVVLGIMESAFSKPMPPVFKIHFHNPGAMQRGYFS